MSPAITLEARNITSLPVDPDAFWTPERRALLQLPQDEIARARRRQAAYWRHEKPDAWPILLRAPLTRAQEQLPRPDFAEAFRDADMMICGELRGALAVANAGSEQVPSIRVNFGTGTLLSCLGLEQLVFPDKMPWLREHMPIETAARLTPDDIRIRGTFARGLEFMKYMRAVLGDAVPVYYMDSQGPFDLAHLLLGDEIFYLMTDEPALVKQIMELCLELGLRTHRWMNEIIGAPHGTHHHGNSLYAENMGIRICEDTTALISPAAMEEFALPYTRRLAQAFGGAWVHYCGRNDQLTRRILAIPEIRGINFGHIPGHELDHDFETDMKQITAAGKIYHGAWPRREGESGKSFLQRMHPWVRQGSLLVEGNYAVGGQDGFADTNAVRDYWRRLQ